MLMMRVSLGQIPADAHDACISADAHDARMLGVQLAGVFQLMLMMCESLRGQLAGVFQLMLMMQLVSAGRGLQLMLMMCACW